jgi:hypothetical protein
MLLQTLSSELEGVSSPTTSMNPSTNPYLTTVHEASAFFYYYLDCHLLS